MPDVLESLCNSEGGDPVTWNDEVVNGLIDSMTVVELSELRERVDQTIKSVLIERTDNPDEILEYHFHNLFLDGGQAAHPVIESGLVLIATSVTYGKGDNHECIQVTVRTNKAEPECWVWDHDAVQARQMVKTDESYMSAQALIPEHGMVIGVHPMVKRKRSKATFASHERQHPTYYRVNETTDSSGEVVISLDTAYDVEPSKLPLPAQV